MVVWFFFDIHTSLCVADIIELLLHHGAKVNEKNGLGWTSLDEAVSCGDKPTSE